MNIREDRRKATRFDISADVRFLLRGNDEGAGKLLNMSECGLALIAEADAKEGDQIVVYPEGIGRVSGEVVRTFEGGFSIAFTLTETQQPTMKDRLAAAISGLPYFRLSEQRSSIRVSHNIETYARFENGEEFSPCVIVDMSRWGCRVRCDRRPAIGAPIVIGSLNSTVARHTMDGFAVEFARSSATSNGSSSEDRAPGDGTLEDGAPEGGTLEDGAPEGGAPGIQHTQEDRPGEIDLFNGSKKYSTGPG